MERAASADQTAHPPQPQRPHNSRWLVPAIILAVILTVVGNMAIAASYYVEFTNLQQIAYRYQAPAGWTNATLQGNTSGMQYAISQNDPGVILGCGTRFGSYQDTTACWRTSDGGAQWQILREGPFENAPAFLLAAPRDAGQTFFAIENNTLDGATPAADAIWVTHDAGQGWGKVTTLTLDYDGARTETEELSNAIYRNGRLYDLLEKTGQLDVIPRTFSVSLNDGATWTPVERGPSALEQQGWSGYSFAADYRSPNSWFRTMEREGHGEYLEHSADDGRSWQTVSEITSTAPVAFAKLARDSLASTPARPGALCASGFGVGLVASADGGHTWRDGVPSSSMMRWQGDQTGDVHIGADGTCYASYDHQFTPNNPIYKWLYGLPEELALLQLAPHANQITEAPLPTGYSDGYSDNTNDLFTYVPTGHGMSARLVLQANTSQSSWFSAFSGGDPTSSNLLIWRTAP